MGQIKGKLEGEQKSQSNMGIGIGLVTPGISSLPLSLLVNLTLPAVSEGQPHDQNLWSSETEPGVDTWPTLSQSDIFI